MDDTEWMFDAFAYLGDAADEAGMKRLAAMMEICMDVYLEEAALVSDAAFVFRSSRASAARERNAVWPFDQSPKDRARPVPSPWLAELEAAMESTVTGYATRVVIA